MSRLSAGKLVQMLELLVAGNVFEQNKTRLEIPGVELRIQKEHHVDESERLLFGRHAEGSRAPDAVIDAGTDTFIPKLSAILRKNTPQMSESAPLEVFIQASLVRIELLLPNNHFSGVLY